MCFNNSLSDKKIINTGVPQAYIHGSLLILICTNDLPDSFSNSDSLPYADDTNLIIAGSNIQTLCSKLNEDSKKLTT